MDKALFGKVDDYISGLLAQEDEALVNTVRSIEEAGMRQISVSATQGKMLQTLARMCNARRILELGTLAGYSTIWMARALPEGGRLISLEYSPEHAAVARKNIAHAGLEDKVDIRVGAALELLPLIARNEPGLFDMVFIDADKPPYTEYFQWALKLTRKGGVIVADNVIREGHILNEHSNDDKVQGVQRFNKFLSGCSEVTAIILQTVGAKEHDGIAIAVVN